MEKISELFRGAGGGGDKSGAFVGIEACQDGDVAVPSPGFPGGDGRGWDEAAWAVDDGLEGPADGGLVFGKDGFGGVLDFCGCEGAEGGHEGVFWDVGAAELGEEVLELGFVEGVGWGVDCSCCWGSGF